MSKLHLIQEIETTVKMVSGEYDTIKLSMYLDELLSNYKIETKDEEFAHDDNESYIDMFLSALKVENYSHLTLKNYQYELKSFSAFLNKPVLKASTADIRRYLAASEHLKQSTIVSKLDVLSSFFNWLVKEDELLRNPCIKIKRPRLPKKVREGLTVVELEQVRAACKDVRQRALIEVFYSTGCRLDELRKIDIDNIDWETSSVIVCGKGDKERKVFLSEKAKYYLKQYLEERNDDCSALFASERRPIRRLTNEGIQYQIKQIKKASNIDKPLHPHVMRHTFAQLNLNAGMELADLQALLGHEKADTTARYAQVSEERKYSAFRRFHLQ